MKEMPVPTADPRPGEQPWPTQPIPLTASGKPMAPVCPVVPLDIPPEQLANNKIVPQFTPPAPNRFFAPGSEGGANYGPISYSPQTGLLYVNAHRQPDQFGPSARKDISPRTIRRPENSHGSRYSRAGDRPGRSSPPAASCLPAAGSNTAGYFFAYNAKTGEPLWKFNTGAGVFSSPSIYMVNGEEFVTVASGGGERGRRGGDLILSFALPKP